MTDEQLFRLSDILGCVTPEAIVQAWRYDEGNDRQMLAWQVIEAMTRGGWGCSVEFGHDVFADMWAAMFTDMAAGRGNGWSVSNRMPEAVIEAAVMALEGRQ